MKPENRDEEKKKAFDLKKSYKDISSTLAMEDLVSMLESEEQTLIENAMDRRMKMPDGKMINIDSETANTLIQRAAAYRSVRQYIDRLST